MREGEVGGPCPVLARLGAEPFVGQLKLDASVAHRRHVDEHRRETCRWVEGHVREDVLAHFVVEVQRTTEAVVEEGVVDTDIGCSALLPFKVGVGRAFYLAHWQVGVGVEVAGSGCHVARGSLIDVTGHTIAGAEFEEVYPLQVFHELLVVDEPSCTYRPQRLAAELGVKSINVGIVLTERSEHVVLVVVGVGSVEIAGGILVVSVGDNAHCIAYIGVEHELRCGVAA